MVSHNIPYPAPFTSLVYGCFLFLIYLYLVVCFVPTECLKSIGISVVLQIVFSVTVVVHFSSRYKTTTKKRNLY